MVDSPVTSTPQADPSFTPISSDSLVLSKKPFVASNPPSSPPEYPTSTKYDTTPSKPARSVTNAFSVLGKRKSAASINYSARSVRRHPTIKAKDGKSCSQMQISIGQKVQKRCKACGMEYIASSNEDRKLHDKYHKQNVEGYDLGKDFLSKCREGSVFDGSRNGDCIATVDSHDKPWRRKRARAILDAAQRELGAVDISDKQLWDPSYQHLTDELNISRHTVYMYVRHRKCIGLLLVERIMEGNKVVQQSTRRPRADDVPAKARMSALERLRERRVLQKDSEAELQPIQLSMESTPASLGVSRIWTSPSHRGQGIAQCLLDRALEHYNARANEAAVDGSKVDLDPTAAAPSRQHTGQITKDHVAFSQPIDAGARLAKKWVGNRYGWLVYSP